MGVIIGQLKRTKDVIDGKTGQIISRNGKPVTGETVN